MSDPISRCQPINGHTPTPWVADQDWREGYSWNIHILDAANPDMRICFMTSDGPAEANAALIVEAVNNYATLKARVAELEGAFRAADDIDWAHLDQFIPQSGHGRFWKSVFAELRAALSHAGPVTRDGER